MEPYLLLIGAIILMFAIASGRKRFGVVALGASFLLMWILASFRASSVGIDTGNYRMFFDGIVSGTVDIFSQITFSNTIIADGFENGFRVYTYAISLITADFTVYLAISYAIMYYLFFKFIKKYSENYFMSVMIFLSLFFFASMNQFRQMLAISIATWGFKYIIERNFLKYLFVVLLATSIHQSSIILLIPYFAYGWKISSRMKLIYGSIAIFLFLAVAPLVEFFASGNMRYETYLTKLDAVQLGSFIVFAIYAGLLVIISKMNKKRQNDADLSLGTFYIHMAILATLISFVSIRMTGFNRFIEFFSIFLVVAIPFFIVYNKERKYRATKMTLFAVVLLLYAFISMILRPEWLGVWPYVFA